MTKKSTERDWFGLGLLDTYVAGLSTNDSHFTCWSRLSLMYEYLLNLIAKITGLFI